MKIHMKNSQQSGFVALFTVTFISFVALFFLATIFPRIWTEAAHAEEARNQYRARFRAISCINIARQQIAFHRNLGSSQGELPARFYAGNNDGDSDRCQIERVVQTGSMYEIETSAGEIQLTAKIDQNSHRILSMQESVM